MKSLARTSLRAILAAALALTAACGADPSTSDTLASSSRWAQEAARYQPHPLRTPGHLCTTQNPDFDEYRYSQRIIHCRRDVSSSLKKDIKDQYGIPVARRGEYEVDHLIPLSIGGSNERENLWPLWSPIARLKSEYEQELQIEVIEGIKTQAQAIEAIKAWRPSASQPRN